MKHRIAIRVALVAAAFPTFVSAQVANGNFESGLASWSLKDAIFEPAAGQGCSNAPYAVSKRSTSTKAAAPAAGRVVQVTPNVHYAPGAWLLCSELEQTLYVPMGKQLKFVSRVGEGIYPSPYQIESGSLSVDVIDGGRSTTLFSRTGFNIECSNGQWPCPAYGAQVVDMSPYWGKTVRLVFRGGSWVRNGQSGGISYPSYAYLDNVRLE